MFSGAFLIPYFTMLVFGGLPLFYMELCLGQFHRLFSHPETTATKNVIIWKEYREQSCFYQVWLPFSLEEDLSSFKRGETSNLISQETDIQSHENTFILKTKVGYAICVIDIYMGMFYNTIIGWAVYYFVAR